MLQCDHTCDTHQNVRSGVYTLHVVLRRVWRVYLQHVTNHTRTKCFAHTHTRFEKVMERMKSVLGSGMVCHRIASEFICSTTKIISSLDVFRTHTYMLKKRWIV